MEQIPTKTFENVHEKKHLTVLIYILQISVYCKYVHEESEDTMEIQGDKANYHQDTKAEIVKTPIQEGKFPQGVGH